jgi:hypothetical protein
MPHEGQTKVDTTGSGSLLMVRFTY